MKKYLGLVLLGASLFVVGCSEHRYNRPYYGGGGPYNGGPYYSGPYSGSRDRVYRDQERARREAERERYRHSRHEQRERERERREHDRYYGR